jgi:translation elongation factor EF-G
VKHTDKSKDIHVFEVKDLFILMGGENLKVVEKVGAGNIVGIGGLDDILYNMGTLSDKEYCPSFAKASL